MSTAVPTASNDTTDSNELFWVRCNVNSASPTWISSILRRLPPADFFGEVD